MRVLPEIIANVGRGWNRDPASVALGTEITGVSAALWTHDKDDVQEVWGPPIGAHLISIQQTPYWAELTIDGRLAYRANLNRGDMSLIRAGTAPRALQKGRWSILHLYVPAILLQALNDELVGSSIDPVESLAARVFSDEGIRRIGEEVMAEMTESLPLSRLRIDTLGQDLAIQLLRRRSNLDRTVELKVAQSRGGLAPWQVRRTTGYILDQLDRDVSLAELAGIAKLSAYHFCRAFKRSVGVSPGQWQVQQRIKRAQELMLDTDKPLAEIALEVGYASHGALRSAFKRITGQSPADWRRRKCD